MEGIVFAIDCIDSKKHPDLFEGLCLNLAKLNENPYRNSHILSPYTLLRGDEIECVLSKDADFIKQIRYVREACFPMRIRIGVGVGNIGGEMEEIKGTNPWTLNGEAFHFARAALNKLDTSKLFSKKPLSYMLTKDSKKDQLINASLLLYDTLLSQWSSKAFEAVSLHEHAGSFSNIDTKPLGISKGAIKKRASAAHWSEIELFEDEILKSYNN